MISMSQAAGLEKANPAFPFREFEIKACPWEKECGQLLEAGKGKGTLSLEVQLLCKQH